MSNGQRSKLFKVVQSCSKLVKVGQCCFMLFNVQLSMSNVEIYMLNVQ